MRQLPDFHLCYPPTQLLLGLVIFDPLFICPTSIKAALHKPKVVCNDVKWHNKTIIMKGQWQMRRIWFLSAAPNRALVLNPASVTSVCNHQLWIHTADRLQYTVCLQQATILVYSQKVSIWVYVFYSGANTWPTAMLSVYIQYKQTWYSEKMKTKLVLNCLH